MISDYSINRLSPVNWSHPLNRGLVAWWLTMPGWNFGSTWRDLCGRYHGTLTNMDPATDWVSGAGRPGGFGAIDTDGSNDVVSSSMSDINSATAATISGWVYRSATGTKQAFGFNNSSATDYSILWFTDNNIYCNVGTSFPTAASTLTGWHHLVHVYSGAAATKQLLYIDGVNVTLSGSTSATSLNASAGNGYWVGRDFANGFCTGQYDDLRVYNRDLAAHEAQQLYNDSRQGYPGTLNRINHRSQRFVSGGGPPAATVRQLAMLGVG